MTVLAQNSGLYKHVDSKYNINEVIKNITTQGTRILSCSTDTVIYMEKVFKLLECKEYLWFVFH